MPDNYMVGDWLTTAHPRYRPIAYGAPQGNPRRRYIWGCRGSRNPARRPQGRAFAQRKEPRRDCLDAALPSIAPAVEARRADPNRETAGAWLLIGLCVVGALVVAWMGAL